MRGLSKKRVLVTGAAQGIGLAVAARFLEEGALVLLTDVRSEAVLAAVANLEARHGGRVFGHMLDVADETAISEAFALACRAMGGLDVLVNNAGINRPGASHVFTSEDFDTVLAVNLRGAFLCCRAAINVFLSQGSGIIINNSSNHEIVPKPGFVAYAVSKGGLGNLTRTLALEYADRNIRVNSVAPGAVVTPLNASWTEDPVKRSQVEAHIPLGRAAAASEVAGSFVFLASDDAAYITGQTLYVDGGLTLHADFRNNWAS